MKTGVIVGGTGAQGAAVVRHLSSTGTYHLNVLTRNVNSPHAQELAHLANVTLIQSTPSGYDEKSFLQAATNADFAFVNTDGFSIGSVAETYWGIRFYELARRAGVKHYLYSSLDKLGELTQYREEFDVGHFAGKARVVDFLKSQPTTESTWSAITSGPYLEMLHESLAPRLSPDGKTHLFTYPLSTGSLPFIHLDDFARYVGKILSDHIAYAGKELKVGTAHVSGEDIARAFTSVTGKPARYVNVPIEAWLSAAFGHHVHGADTPIGLQAYPGLRGDAQGIFLPLTWAQNFAGSWNVWAHSGGDAGIIKRDYGMLDDLLPDRVRGVEEWMGKVGYTAEKRQVLRTRTDDHAEVSPWENVPGSG